MTNIKNLLFCIFLFIGASNSCIAQKGTTFFPKKAIIYKAFSNGSDGLPMKFMAVVCDNAITIYSDLEDYLEGMGMLYFAGPFPKPKGLCDPPGHCNDITIKMTNKHEIVMSTPSSNQTIPLKALYLSQDLAKSIQDDGLRFEPLN